MNKKAIFIFVLIIIFCICFYLGYTIQKNKKQNDIIRNDMLLNERTNNRVEEDTIETTSQEEKTTPNTILTLKKYYTDCGHTIGNSSTIPEEMVNLTEKEIKEKYTNWEIEKFSKEEIILTRNLESFCGEHYYITEENNHISIYAVDEAGNKTLKEEGNISCEYLPETDRINLRNGINIYGTEELNKTLENFES